MRTSKPKPIFDEENLYEYAIRALASRMRSVAELKRLLRRRAAGEDAEARIEAIVARLKEHQYLNDQVYATTYSHYRRDDQKFGKLRVISDLKARGVHGDVIRQAVDAAFAGTDEEQQAREFLRRKRIPQPKDDRQAARIFRTLLRAGFGKRVIVHILKKWKVDDETLTALESETE